MAKVLNIILASCFLVTAIIANTGYYWCYSQETTHVFEACCNENEIEESCCSSADDTSQEALQNKCCDKIDIHSLGDQNCNPRAQIVECDNINLNFLISPFLINHTQSPKVYLHKSPPKSPPSIAGQNTYKINCSFIC
ncbi:MAG: hypothetical protein MK132_14805 [Lentisphaerales bacterium]|nr:hypothetical protein [Lentisphaerales bacterium]